MRPQGDVRQAIGKAARELAAERAVTPGFVAAGSTWRELGARACVGYQVARQTVQNMARTGELQRMATMRTEGSRRPMMLFGPGTSGLPGECLDVVMRGWPQS